jgi:hypothetical protein
MPDLLAALERHSELKVSAEVRAQLLSMSSSTCDRLLRKQHRRLSVLPPAHKAPAATSLKSEVPLKTWSEWADVKPGSLQADLVVHSGESAAGFFLTTLTAIDIASGWIELQPVWGKGMTRVGAAVHYIRERLPFPLAALHTDNGSEFINEVLVPCAGARRSLSPAAALTRRTTRPTWNSGTGRACAATSATSAIAPRQLTNCCCAFILYSVSR